MKYLIQFLLSGVTAITILLISKNIGPKYGAALYALPIEFSLIAIFMFKSSGSIAYVFKQVGLSNESWDTDSKISIYKIAKHK